MRAVALAVLFLASGMATAAAQENTAVCPPAPNGVPLAGHVVSGKTPLPGVSVSLADPGQHCRYVTSTAVDGSFALTALPGKYQLTAELAGFAPANKQVDLAAVGASLSLSLDMVLASRAHPANTAPSAPSTTAANRGPAGRGMQNLNLRRGNAQEDLSADIPPVVTPGQQNPDVATESVSIAGNQGQVAQGYQGTDDRLEMRPEGGGGPGGFAGGGGQVINVPGAGGPGGFGGGPGGFGGGGGGRGGMRGFNLNQPHGTLYYQLGDSALNAAPYSLTGTPSVKPSYEQNRFGALVGGPLKIPHLYDGKNTFFFFNWTGTRNTNPFDQFAIVPTEAERNGDFQGLTDRQGNPITIIDPATGQPFTNNTIPQAMINKAAKALLNYVPLPNQAPGSLQNFHEVSTVNSDTDQINLRLIHNFGSAGSNSRQARGGGGGYGMGRSQHNINFALSYQRNNTDQPSVFPQLSGTSATHNLSASGGYTFSHGHFTFTLRGGYNQSHLRTTDLFGYDVESALGLNGVGAIPAEYGLPNLSFSDFTGMNQVSPSDSNQKTFNLTPQARWRRGKHNVTFGGDYHRNATTLEDAGNARGSFVFTGFSTGYDLADFLLGLPQQTSEQTIEGGAYHFRANNYSLYVMDDWRVLSNLTVNAGIRYEYAGPYYELQNRLATLDPAPGFYNVAPVLPGQSGPYSGLFPRSLVEPDRNNWAPRIGIAWKPMKNTVVRAGYGINYNLSEYGTIVQQLALQPPFAVASINSCSPGVSCDLTLNNGFPAAAPGIVSNSYAVNKNYKLPYVQSWTLDIQRQLPKSILVNITYQGAKGTDLDVQTAPNRTPTGLLNPNVNAFYFERSIGNSIYHAGSVRVRKRLKNGISLGGTYRYSKSIDDASSIGGGAVIVAQNPLDIAAERGLSIFDQRHNFTGDFYYELPFGADKKFLHGDHWFDHALSNMQLSGSWTLASGSPFTARVLGSFTDVAGGVNGTLRANYNGAPISGPQTISEWFNTAAFSAPAPGTYGTAGRDTIEGPGSALFNLSFSKAMQFAPTRRLEFRLSGTNVLNHPVWAGIDTVVNSPTFGQVISAGSMRTIAFITRFQF